MAYENYIPTIETKKMLKERDKNLVFVANTTREWEGEIKSRGDHIKINGIGSPSVWMLQKNGTYTANQALTAEGKAGATRAAGSGKDVIQRGIPDWEEVQTYSIQLPVNQEAVWNYGVGDLDQQMITEKGMVAKLRNKQAKRLAEIQDRYVAKVMARFAPATFAMTNFATVSENNILDLLDAMVLRLNEQNVSDSEQLYCECSPKFWSILKKAYRDLDTDNSDLLAHRKLGRYNDIIIAKSNNANVLKDDGSAYEEYIFVHTKDAVAFFDPLTKNEAYRPQNGFADCVKGFSWFDAGIVDKNALLVAKIAY